MPILPPIAAQNYDSVNLCLTSAAARLNDEVPTLLPVSGRLMGDSEFFTQQSVNSAWRNMQDCLADRGYATMLNEVVISGLPVVALTDPGTQTWLSWAGYFDGANFFDSILLPSDFTHPVKVWERWSGQSAEFPDPPMTKILDGLPATRKTQSIRFWEWRGDAIYMPGSMMVEDLRIRYVRYLPDFADAGDQRWFNGVIPIMRGSGALSWFVCSEFAVSRGELALSQVFRNKGEASLSHVFNLDVKADQRVNVQRRPRGRGFRY